MPAHEPADADDVVGLLDLGAQVLARNIVELVRPVNRVRKVASGQPLHQHAHCRARVANMHVEKRKILLRHPVAHHCRFDGVDESHDAALRCAQAQPPPQGARKRPRIALGPRGERGDGALSAIGLDAIGCLGFCLLGGVALRFGAIRAVDRRGRDIVAEGPQTLDLAQDERVRDRRIRTDQVGQARLDRGDRVGHSRHLTIVVLVVLTVPDVQYEGGLNSRMLKNGEIWRMK